MKISQLIVAGVILAVALPAAAATSKNPITRKKLRKPPIVKPAEAPAPTVAAPKSSEADPTKSWQAYSFP